MDFYTCVTRFATGFIFGMVVGLWHYENWEAAYQTGLMSAMVRLYVYAVVAKWKSIRKDYERKYPNT